MIEYMGEGQKQILFDQLTYSKYAPNYTTTARSQQSSKLFNFANNVASGVKNVLGLDELCYYRRNSSTKALELICV